MNTTEFMLHLAKQLVTERKVAESTANAYVKVLYALNDKKPFKNLTFLKATDAIDKRIAEYAESTQRAVVASIVSVLSLFKDKPTFKKPYTHYYDAMMAKSKVAREVEAKNEKTETQKTNWLSWEDVEKHQKDLDEKVGKFAKSKVLTPAEYETLLQMMVLALYTDIQPRRNQDYLDMYVVKKYSETLPKDKNYLDLATKRFIFHKYKTAKKYGVQTEEVPERLWATLALYLKQHPLWKAVANRKDAVKLLVSHSGEPIVAVNAITRILNRIFGKKVGSSMLRHIYLSDKYGDTLTEMKKDSEAMGHSLGVQKNYIKNDASPHLVISETTENKQ
jgi:integrase